MNDYFMTNGTINITHSNEIETVSIPHGICAIVCGIVPSHFHSVHLFQI